MLRHAHVPTAQTRLSCRVPSAPSTRHVSMPLSPLPHTAMQSTDLIARPLLSSHPLIPSHPISFPATHFLLCIRIPRLSYAAVLLAVSQHTWLFPSRNAFFTTCSAGLFLAFLDSPSLPPACALHSAALCCPLLFCPALRSAALCCAALPCPALPCALLPSAVLPCRDVVGLSARTCGPEGSALRSAGDARELVKRVRATAGEGKRDEWVAERVWCESPVGH